MRRRHIVLGLVIVLLAGGACGGGGGGEDRLLAADPAVTPYDGPLAARAVDDDDDDAAGRTGGVAESALECDGEPHDAGLVEYLDGLSEVRGSPAGALAELLDGSAMPSPGLPTEGYRRERDEGHRLLLSYDVDSETKVAVVVADGVEDHRGNRGWGVEAWARCDPSELPAAVSDRSGIGVWEDEGGRRVPVTEISSFQGPEHCGWQGVTFVDVAAADPPVRLARDPGGVLAGHLTTSFAEVAALPGGATDTGYRRGGRALWLSADRAAAYLVAEPGDVERWAAVVSPEVACE